MSNIEFELAIFESEEYIFKEDEPSGGAYLIAQGAVDIHKTKHGQKIHIATKTRDDIFGEMAMISDKERSASAQATEHTTCYKLTEQNFTILINDLHPFMKAIFGKLSHTLRQQTDTQSLVEATDRLYTKTKESHKQEKKSE